MTSVSFEADIKPIFAQFVGEMRLAARPDELRRRAGQRGADLHLHPVGGPGRPDAAAAVRAAHSRADRPVQDVDRRGVPSLTRGERPPAGGGLVSQVKAVRRVASGADVPDERGV